MAKEDFDDLDKWIVDTFFPPFIARQFSKDRNENARIKHYITIAVAEIRKEIDKRYLSKE